MSQFFASGENVGFKLNIQETKIMASDSITSWQIDGETGNSNRFYFGGSKIIADFDTVIDANI